MKTKRMKLAAFAGMVASSALVQAQSPISINAAPPPPPAKSGMMPAAAAPDMQAEELSS